MGVQGAVLELCGETVVLLLRFVCVGRVCVAIFCSQRLFEVAKCRQVLPVKTLRVCCGLSVSASADGGCVFSGACAEHLGVLYVIQWTCIQQMYWLEC